MFILRCVQHCLQGQRSRSVQNAHKSYLQTTWSKGVSFDVHTHNQPPGTNMVFKVKVQDHCANAVFVSINMVSEKSFNVGYLNSIIT